MSVMGEETPDVWTDEFRRTGRVVFPVRRRPVLIRLALALVFAGNQAISLAGELDERGIGLILRLVSFAAVLAVVGLCGWQLISRRPVLTVDHEGVRLGRRPLMPWTGIGSIGVPHGKFFMMLPVIPADVWAKHLILTQDNVKNVPAFATWLTGVLEEHRRSTPT